MTALHRLLLGIAVPVVVLCLAVAYVFFVRRPSGATPFLRVEVPADADAHSVALALQKAGALEHPRVYEWYAHLDPLAANPRPGVYAVRRGMSYRRLATSFAFGPQREEISMTVVEGWTIRDMISALAAKGIDARPSDFFASRFSADFSFLQNLPADASLEGYLFPDTYRVWKDEAPDSLLRKQLNEFRNVMGSFGDDVTRSGKSLRDILIVASIVEKEVRTPEDKKIVAGIFWNRMKDGIPLQSDATLNYVIGAGRARATADDLQKDSPYNTYKYKGLPPGPIGNPGKDSLDAALHPTDTTYRYFLTDASGKVYYGSTLQEHAWNRRKAFGN